MSDPCLPSRISTSVAVFDLDGTLYDKRGLVPRIVLSQLGHLGLLKAERAVRKSLAGCDFGTGDEFYRQFFGRIASLTARTPEQVAAWYNSCYMPATVKVLASGFRLRSWVQPALAELHGRGVRVAVFSDYPFARQKLEALGFPAQWADAGIFDAPSLGGLKPCRESFLRLAAAIGADPADITVIGDRADTDVEGARRSGMSSVLV